MIKATWNGAVLAESDQTILIEGNHYFPPDAIHREFFSENDNHSTCPWKGEASYYDITVDGEVNADAAWYYPAPKAGASEQLGGVDFTNYVAFWRGVEVG